MVLVGNLQLMSQPLLCHSFSNMAVADSCLEITYDLRFI